MAVKSKANEKPYRGTPLVESKVLSKAAGCRIFLKLENLQPSGSFKSRGIGHFCQQALHRSKNPERVHFYASSGGNAGLACVHAANFLGSPSTVVVPMSTKPAMIERIRAAGASEIIRAGTHLDESGVYLREVVIPQAMARNEEPIYVHPFDRKEIFAGHSTIVHEIDQQLQALGEGVPDALVCSVGGGGLFCGVMQGIAELGQGWQNTKIVAAQTLGAHALSASLEVGGLVTLPAITSEATSLGVSQCAQDAFNLAVIGKASGQVKNVVFTDAEAAQACYRFADDEKILVELACSVSIALCYNNRLAETLGRPVSESDKVVIVVCGGSNISTQMVERYRREFPLAES